MAFLKTNTVDIIVGGITYNSLDDFGLAIENTDYIGTPMQPTNNMVIVPGRSGVLDLTDAVFGRQYFQYRPIAVKFGGLEAPENWDGVISTFRNLFEGRIVNLIFATDPDWYWTGRCSVDAFKHQRALGTFTLRIDYADPYKYAVNETTYEVIAASSGRTQTCMNLRKQVIPAFYATDEGITVSFGDVSHLLTASTVQQFDDIVFGEGANDIIVTGTAGTVTVTYREGSL